uniref:Uncharacterized protein n=1 Tax=Panagrolaimus sp. ES5 TaxID=591445 RepID=A0AC34FT46_9BILA
MVFIFIIFVTVFFNAILTSTIIFKCSRKRGDTGPEIISSRSNINNNASTSNRNNTDREMEKMTDSQRAKFQAELDAAIEAEKKGHVKGNGGGSPASPVNGSGGGMDGTLPISFKKPISEGRSTNVNQPVIWSIGHDDNNNNNKKGDVIKSAPERKKGLKNFSEKVFKRKAKSK